MPAESTATAATTDAPSVNGKSRKIKIALADDHTIFRDGLRRLLQLEPDFDIVAEAEDGSEVPDI